MLRCRRVQKTVRYVGSRVRVSPTRGSVKCPNASVQCQREFTVPDVLDVVDLSSSRNYAIQAVQAPATPAAYVPSCPRTSVASAATPYTRDELRWRPHIGRPAPLYGRPDAFGCRCDGSTSTPA